MGRCGGGGSTNVGHVEEDVTGEGDQRKEAEDEVRHCEAGVEAVRERRGDRERDREIEIPTRARAALPSVSLLNFLSAGNKEGNSLHRAPHFPLPLSSLPSSWNPR